MNKRSQHLTTAIAVIGIVIACSVINTSTASAGSYGVTQCHGVSFAGLSPQFNFTPGWGTAWRGANSCPAGLNIYGDGKSGTTAWWQMTAPPGVTINSVAFEGSGSATAQVPIFSVLCLDSGAPVCAWVDYEAVNTLGGLHSLSGAGTVFRIQMGSQGTIGYNTSGWVAISKLDFNLSESTAPQIASPTGNIAFGDWNRGNKLGGVSASDPGSGIKSLAAIVDGSAVSPGSTASTQPCTATQVIPCPTTAGGWQPIIATSSMSDGPHTIYYAASDYAANSSATGTYSFKVDNTAPATPADIDVPGANEGWKSVNDFDVNWSNGPEVNETSTQSGISKVRVDVEPTDPGSQSNPAPVEIPVGGSVGGVDATANSLEGLTVPANGKWKVRLALVDRAGNVSPVGDGSGGSANSDLQIGFDPNPPAKPNGYFNGWISRSELAEGYYQEWNFTTPPGAASPICGFAGKISLAQGDDPGSAINIPGDVRKWQLPASLSEANHWVNLRAVACSGLASPTVESVEAKVDLTDPIATITGVEPGKWYRDGQQIGLHGTDALSGMAPSTSPKFNEGAYLSHAINGQDGPVIRGGEGAVSVTGEGQKELSFSPVDFAGNKARAKVIRFGIDATNPTGHFTARSVDNPRLLAAPIGDGVSGISVAMIEIRQQAGGDWKLLPTSLADLTGNPVGGNPTSAVASAIVPDTSLPKGTYVARVRAYDQAGNELNTSTDANGHAMTFDNPMREAAVLSAGLSKAARLCGKRYSYKDKPKRRKSKKNGSCIKKYRGKVVFSGTKPALSVSYKRGAVVQGVLTTGKLARIGRQPIEIYTRVRGKNEILAGTTSTRKDGTYLFRLKPGMSRTVRVYYPGTNLREDASTFVKLGTGAKLKLRVSKRHAKTGQTVTFKGSVTSYDRSMPASGKIVALQFYAGKKWRPAVAIAHTDSKGRFKVRYKFDGKRVKARIVFRVIAPTEDNWNHASSASKRITMKLN